MDKTQFISGVCDLYDERLLESRLTEEGNVCGSLLKDLTLYDDCGLTPKDFVTKSGRKEIISLCATKAVIISVLPISSTGVMSSDFFASSLSKTRR